MRVKHRSDGIFWPLRLGAVPIDRVRTGRHGSDNNFTTSPGVLCHSKPASKRRRAERRGLAWREKGTSLVLKPHRCQLNELRLKAPRTARRSHSAAFFGSVGLAALLKEKPE
jgi:hypothetical protein